MLPNKPSMTLIVDCVVVYLYIVLNFRSCLSAQDPLCGWSAIDNKCISWDKGLYNILFSFYERFWTSSFS